MRNLYSRLGIGPAASAEEIRTAIDGCSNASTRIDATEVLLSPDRRRSYDRVHTVLMDIGKLRAALGLSHSENWRGDEAADYTLPAAAARSRYAEFRTKIANDMVQQAQRREGRTRQARRQQARRAVGRGAGRIGDAVASLLRGLWELFVGLVKVAAVFAAIGVAIYIFGTFIDQDKRADTGARPAAASPPPAFRAPPVAQPHSGTIRRFAPGEPIAPFQIQTRGAGGYLLKLEDAYRGTDVMDIFVRGGDTVEVEVPLGNYVVKYAAGDTWYGYDYHFGPETTYTKAETTFDFRDDGYQITGYTVTLYQVRDGNMQMRRLSPADF